MAKVIEKPVKEVSQESGKTRVLQFQLEDQEGMKYNNYDTFHEAFSKKQEGDRVTHSWVNRGR